MRISVLVSRLANYYARYGFLATIQRLGLATKRLFLNHTFVFYCDLSRPTRSQAEPPRSLKVERLTSYAELGPQDLTKLISFADSELAHRYIRERFANGASLWLIRWGDMLAGYSWTIRGYAMEPYYLPLTPDDVRLFDVYAFPEFRGRGVPWFLLTHILRELRGEGAARVFADVAEFNQASLSLYKMTPFQRLGVARMYKLFGYTFIRWADSETMQQVQKQTEPTRELTLANK